MPERKGRSRGLGHLHGHQGFSIVELLIVVAVILIIASIAVPNFMRSKMRANEATAVQNARNVTTAKVVYSTTYGIGSSPASQARARCRRVDLGGRERCWFD